MLKKVNKKYLIVLAILVFILLSFIMVVLFSENYGIEEVSSNNEKQKYKYHSQLIYSNEKIIKIISYDSITDEEIKEIYDKYNKQYENFKIWLYETEEDAMNLDSYNIAEITKENGEYKIHRYEEKTEGNIDVTNSVDNNTSNLIENINEEKNINNTTSTSSNTTSKSANNTNDKSENSTSALSNSNNTINSNTSDSDNANTNVNSTTITTEEKNALSLAKSYLNYSAFSYSGLIKQLEYEGYSSSDAKYAVDNCGANWNEQALKSAKSYLSYSAFSYSGLIKQLEYEGFTNSQALYGVDNCGANWNEQARKSAKSYISYSSFSRNELINQLKYEGFTQEQAVYGVEANGL